LSSDRCSKCSKKHSSTVKVKGGYTEVLTRSVTV
jgi:hypothetical protein